MAISRKVGQDSEGVPIHKRDSLNKPLDALDEDLSDISAAYQDFRLGKLKSSGYYFSVDSSNIDEEKRINPQLFLPHLNETIEDIERLDGSGDWSVTTLGGLDAEIKVFKGPRFKSESIIVEEPSKGIECYYTPSALLQEKSESVKYLDTARASKSQLATIKAIRVYRGDIVITRSGSIGRVSFITKKYDRAIVSDDLIRVRVPDVDLRYYIYGFLQTDFAQNQMARNEYGAIQQHLEPQHIRDMLIPMPLDTSAFSSLVRKMKSTIEARERLEDLNEQGLGAMHSAISKGDEDTKLDN